MNHWQFSAMYCLEAQWYTCTLFDKALQLFTIDWFQMDTHNSKAYNNSWKSSHMFTSTIYLFRIANYENGRDKTINKYASQRMHVCLADVPDWLLLKLMYCVHAQRVIII